MTKRRQLVPIVFALSIGIVHAGSWHVNCGGPGYTAADGTRYEADAFFSGGNEGATNDPVAGTGDDVLYQTERWGAQFSYAKPVDNGSYRLILKFSELYWEQSGQRSFSVDVENQNILAGLDLIASAGHDTAYDVILSGINITDGDININFDSTVDAAKISAISLIPEVLVVADWAVNVGGPAFQSSDGTHYVADEGFSGGNTAAASMDIGNTVDDALYQTERWGTFSYRKALPDGNYRVVLKFAEFYWNSPNQRVFSGEIEGNSAVTNLDLVATAGSQNAYDVIVENVVIEDGELNLSFSASVDAAKLSAIKVEKKALRDPELTYSDYIPHPSDRVISRSQYLNKLHGFWLAESIANWTGLITEMDRIEAPFYTDEIWGTPDQPNIWGFKSPHSANIDFYFGEPGQPWGADDDTDIEYMYQHLLDVNNTSVLTGNQIRTGWLNHIYSNEDAPNGENFLWVSNERAYYLMKDQGLVPPATSEPVNNPDFSMIDAQLTTEIFGLFAPARPDIALQMAHLPIRTTAKIDAEWISEFYVVMYSLASAADSSQSMKDQVFWMAQQARSQLPDNSFPAAMFDFIQTSYLNNPDKTDWEKTRDEVYQRYQISNADGYVYNREFDAGINFAASLVSLFYGEGDLVETVRIGSLTGWDSDNPTATWGGLLGFMLGKDGVEQAFNQYGLSDTYWIHRTRRNFPDYTPGRAGEDSFPAMAERGIYIIDRVILEEMNGGVSLDDDLWYIPQSTQ